jgi:CBS-domain-containing membrane protein
LKRLPVVDGRGYLLGIVSRADLLKPFLRSDESIRREVAEQILRRTLAIDPSHVTIDVRDGIVALDGHVETKSLAELAERLVEGVEGVVGVKDKLTYRLDDSHLRPELPPMALRLSVDERKL